MIGWWLVVKIIEHWIFKFYRSYKLFIASRRIILENPVRTFQVLLFIWVLKCLRLSFVICHTSECFCFKGIKCVSITTVSSNINEDTREILNSFIQNFHNHKQAQNAYKQIKIKNAPKKCLRGKSHLFAYLRFVLLPESLCAV